MNKGFSAWLRKARRSRKKAMQTVRGSETGNRTRHTRLVYTALSVGTVLVAYLLVLANIGVFSLMERGLYDRETYLAVSIVSAGGITDPLSRSARVELYRSCTMQGKDRSPLPEERTRSDAIEQIKTLWEQTLQNTVGQRPSGTLTGGESIDRILRNSRYTATLHDFYNEETNARIAIWGAQAYYTASDKRVYCLSAELDSRTSDVYSMTVALFDVIESDADLDFYPMLDALGEPHSVTSTGVSAGTATTLTLSDGTRLIRETQPGVQRYLTLQ